MQHIMTIFAEEPHIEHDFICQRQTLSLQIDVIP